jgi:hypothetical protein
MGFMPVLPMILFFGFVFFILPKVFWLLPFLLAGAALWWMAAGHRGEWRNWQSEQMRDWGKEWGRGDWARMWRCSDDVGDGEKAKRDEVVIVEEKPKRNSEYV